MEEPSLSCGPPDDVEAYRFLWLRSFHNDIAVRVIRRGDAYALEAVILDGAGRSSAYLRWLVEGTGDYHKPGNVSRRVRRALSRDQWQAVMTKLEEIQLWQMPTQSDVPLLGTDGAQWIVEARRDGRYHVVDRWIGADGLKSIGMLFLDLADLGDVGPVY
jgi:hypothetical protein